MTPWLRASSARTEAISIVIPSWNGRPLLERFLPSVERAAAAYGAHRKAPVEVLVADDASSDDTGAWLAAHYPAVRLERTARQAGFAATANRGVRAARSPLVYLLNNDVALEAHTLLPLVEHFSNSGVFAVSSQVYDYSSGILRGAGQWGEFRRGFLGIHRRYYIPEGSHPPGPVYRSIFASGGSSLFDRDKFLELGGFDELLSPFGWEDVELSLRAWRRGWEVRYEPRSSVWHDFSSTIGRRFSPRRCRTFYERNRLLTHWIHLDTARQWGFHGAFLFLKLAGLPWLGRWEIWSAFWQAFACRPDVRRRRAALRQQAWSSLEQVLTLVATEAQPTGVVELTEASAPARRRPDTVGSGGEPA